MMETGIGGEGRGPRGKRGGVKGGGGKAEGRGGVGVQCVPDRR